MVHAGGAATGAEIERALVEAVRHKAVAIHTRTFLEDLIVVDGVCRGARCLFPDGSRGEVRSAAVLLAAGGAGQLFSVSTNPAGATGDGVAAAMRAGAAVADLEFFQFHPTALFHDRSPRPLLTEALRGHGAVLRNMDGDRFVDELLPRDVVSRAILAEMANQESDHVWLDARDLDGFVDRFPTIASVLESVGLDPSRDLLPVQPAAHHLCGGVLTDLDGATTLEGLWACGEVACTGVHGANRLASNSLLEGMVFAPRAVEAITSGIRGPRPTGAMAGLPTGAGDRPRPVDGSGPIEIRQIDLVDLPFVAQRRSFDGDAPVALELLAGLLEQLQGAMTAGAGVRRSADSLGEVSGELAVVGSGLAAIATSEVGRDQPVAIAVAELANLATLARALVSGALTREESRGTHWRDDYPSPDPAFRLRFTPVVGAGFGPRQPPTQG